MDQHHQEDSEYGPTYKSLFIAVCVILGSSFGWWLTNFISTTSAIHASYERRITELEARARESDVKQERLHRDVDSNTRVLRELERDAVRRRP